MWIICLILIFKRSSDEACYSLCFFCVCIISASNAQKGVHAGKDLNYVHHKVEQGETVFSISKKYLLEQKIFWLPIRVDLGLKEGQILKIPVTGKNGGETGLNVKNRTRSQCLIVRRGFPSFEEYKVKKTILCISLPKGMALKWMDILKYNPGARDGLEKGEIFAYSG